MNWRYFRQKNRNPSLNKMLFYCNRKKKLYNKISRRCKFCKFRKKCKLIKKIEEARKWRL